MWVGTLHGVYETKKSDDKIIYDKISGINGSICQITEDKLGTLWLAAGTDGIVSINKKSHKIHKYLSTLNLPFVRILADESGMIWSVAFGYLIKLNPHTDTFSYYNMAPNGGQFYDIHCLFEDHFLNIWIGANAPAIFDKHLSKPVYFNKKLRPDSTKQFSIICFYQDVKNTLWIGTSNGIDTLDRITRKLKGITSNNNLLNEPIMGILRNNRGFLWVLTLKGISSLNLSTGSVKSYSVDDGAVIPSTAFPNLPFCKGNNGEIYFGGIEGYVKFYPDSIKENTLIPPIEITSFKIFNNEVKLDTAISRKKLINLSYFENNISFEYTALNYTASHKNQYAYMMEGLDKNWVYSGTRRYASYANLQPGKYLFRVKGSNNDGFWNEEGISIAIIIKPPWWGTWWFRVASLLILFIAAGSAVRYVEMKKIKRKIEFLEQDRALERERTRISRDMHDEVGSSLSEIAILSELAKKNPEEAEDHIQEISERAAEVIDSVSEIVWAMNPQNDKLDNLVAHTRRYAVKYLELANISCRFTLPDEIPPHPLSAELRRNIFLVVKEILHNTVKHSCASEVLINVSLLDHSFGMKIGDNGKGFSLEQSTGLGNGLINMKKRIEDIGGVIEIESTCGKGTQINFSVKIS